MSPARMRKSHDWWIPCAGLGRRFFAGRLAAISRRRPPSIASPTSCHRTREVHATIRIVNRTGVPQDQVTTAGATMLNSLDYAADGQGFFTSDYSTDLGARLLYVSLSGATTVLWHNRASFRTWGVPSPDGKWLAMLGATQESNVWVLDGF
jgi:hypothetical protein